MKRFLFLVGIGVGFVVGSWAGRGAYDQIEAKVREVTGKPAVQDVVGQVSGAVKEQATVAKEKVMEKLPSPDTNGTASRHAASSSKS